MGEADRTATQRGPLGHVPALDGLRGVAVLLVLYHHVATVLVPGHATLAASGPIDGGFLGVDLFFVLSGFLITSLLLGERRSFGRTDLVGFYLRRGLRLLPALYVLLAVYFVYAW
ncbi:MAG TPA: acyltransferase, partial [Acidimicrobiales bacterium]